MDLKRLFTVTLVAILLFALTGDHNYFSQREVVVAQLVERSLLTPEVRSSNPVIGKNLC